MRPGCAKATLILTGGSLQAQQEAEYYAQQFVAGAAFEFLSNESLGLTVATDPYSAARTDAPFVYGRVVGRGASLGFSVAEIVFGGGGAGGGLATAPTGVGAVVAMGGAGFIAHGLGVIYRGLTTPLPNIYFASSSGDKQSSQTESHHLLPRQFRDKFKRVGLDIEDYTVDLARDFHKDVHGKGGGEAWINSWNKQWERFFDQNRNPTKDEILRQLRNMKKEFGIP